MTRAAGGSKEATGLRLATLAACLPAALLPIANPDLFWHLSAWTRMRELGSVPKAEWLSWTLAGEPWVDFEWLSQAALGLAFSTGGLAGLWALKAALFAVAVWRLGAWLKTYGLGLEWRVAAVAVWAAGMLPRADIRPELFSVILFIELFRRLESWRLTRRAPSPIVTALAFAAWANLHAGFGYGLALAGVYTLAGLPPATLACAWLGTLANPWGWGIYRVLTSHAAAGAELAFIREWLPADPVNRWRWVELALIPASLAAGAAAWRKGRRPHLVPSLVLAALVVAGLRHARLMVYVVAAGVPLAAGWASGAGLKLGRSAATGLALALGLWTAWLGREYGLGTRVFEPRFAPERTAEYLFEERAALAAKRLYNPWGWGGYLGWRLAPAYRVFQDGRYLFHSLLSEGAKAVASPEAWQSFLASRGIEVAVLENIPLMLPSTRVYPDGTEKSIPRPYHVFYMPRERWALVHFDDKALVFARRDALPKEWLQAREYRWLRPFDGLALDDALSRREVPKPALERELARSQAR